jgi:hypothetical protein
MSLRLDVYVKRKGIDKRARVLDLRRYRQSKDEQQRLIEKLYQDLALFGVKDKDKIIADLRRVPNFANLNFPLLIMAYLYFSEKNFEPGNIILNFNQDFEKIVADIKERGIFDLEKKNSLYTFRQDFIIYLLLINNIDNSLPGNLESEINDLEENKMIYQGEDIDYNRLESLRDREEYDQEEEYGDEYFNELAYY